MGVEKCDRFACDCDWKQFANWKCPDAKVNSVQEACARCFAVHILEFEILEITKKIKQRTSDS